MKYYVTVAYDADTIRRYKSDDVSTPQEAVLQISEYVDSLIQINAYPTRPDDEPEWDELDEEEEDIEEFSVMPGVMDHDEYARRMNAAIAEQEDELADAKNRPDVKRRWRGESPESPHGAARWGA